MPVETEIGRRSIPCINEARILKRDDEKENHFSSACTVVAADADALT